jgi:hypothetical protein
MRMKIEFSMDNEAMKLFPHSEVEEILTSIARRVWNTETEGLCMDSNGNRIGQWTVED